MRWVAASVAVPLALVLLASTATAEKKYRVKIVTEPEGAEIRVDDPDADPIGESPWTGKLPAGPYMLIIDLDGHEQLIEEIVVKKKRKRQTFELELVAVSMGKLRVTGPDEAEGASISVDGEDVGTIPHSMEVTEGSHEVVVEKDGFKRFEKWVQVTGGETHRLKVELESIGPKKVAKRPEKKKRKSKPSAPRVAPLVVATAGFELAWRRWDYLNPRSTSARPFDANVVPLVRAEIEAYPLAFTQSTIAHGLGLRGGIGLGMPPAADAGAAGTIETTWSELEVGALYRVAATPSTGIRADIAWGKVVFGFTEPGVLADEVPDVDYRNLRYGLSLDYASGNVRATFGGSFLSVLQAGAVAQRFTSATASGLGFDGGLWYDIMDRTRIGVAAHYRRFAFDFEPSAMDPVDADGGTDIYFGASLGAAYRY